MLIIGIGSKGEEDTRAIYLSTGVWRSKQKLVDSERAGLRLKGLDRLRVVILGGRNENKEFNIPVTISGLERLIPNRH